MDRFGLRSDGPAVLSPAAQVSFGFRMRHVFACIVIEAVWLVAVIASGLAVLLGAGSLPPGGDGGDFDSSSSRQDDVGKLMLRLFVAGQCVGCALLFPLLVLRYREWKEGQGLREAQRRAIEERPRESWEARASEVQQHATEGRGRTTEATGISSETGAQGPEQSVSVSPNPVPALVDEGSTPSIVTASPAVADLQGVPCGTSGTPAPGTPQAGPVSSAAGPAVPSTTASPAATASDAGGAGPHSSAGAQGSEPGQQGESSGASGGQALGPNAGDEEGFRVVWVTDDAIGSAFLRLPLNAFPPQQGVASVGADGTGSTVEGGEVGPGAGGPGEAAVGGQPREGGGVVVQWEPIIFEGERAIERLPPLPWWRHPNTQKAALEGYRIALWILFIVWFIYGVTVVYMEIGYYDPIYWYAVVVVVLGGLSWGRPDFAVYAVGAGFLFLGALVCLPCVVLLWPKPKPTGAPTQVITKLPSFTFKTRRQKITGLPLGPSESSGPLVSTPSDSGRHIILTGSFASDANIPDSRVNSMVDGDRTAEISLEVAPSQSLEASVMGEVLPTVGPPGSSSEATPEQSGGAPARSQDEEQGQTRPVSSSGPRSWLARVLWSLMAPEKAPAQSGCQCFGGGMVEGGSSGLEGEEGEEGTGPVVGVLWAGTDKEREVDMEDAECSICLGQYEVGDSLRELPCRHNFHCECVDTWLAVNASCPLCKQDILRVPAIGSEESRTADPEQGDQGRQMRRQLARVPGARVAGRLVRGIARLMQPAGNAQESDRRRTPAV